MGRSLHRPNPERPHSVKLIATSLTGAWLVDIERLEDARGFFARTVCTDSFRRHGLNGTFVQQSVSWNRQRGVLRGLHFQAAPHAEEKLVRVTRGRLFDVIVDLRPDSATQNRWFGVELSAQDHRALYIPKGFAHGFQTLEDDTEILYQMTVPYHPESARGVRWNDPALGITWPNPTEAILSERDASLPLASEGASS